MESTSPHPILISSDRENKRRGYFLFWGFTALLFFHSWLAYTSVNLNAQTAFSIKAPAFYGWQTEAFTRGQLHLPVAPNRQLAHLANAYDGNQNRPYRILDLSYFRGNYYLYFGLGPVFSLMLPWRLLTGTYFSDATVVFLASMLSCAAGLGWLALVSRRYFPNVGVVITLSAGAVIALGNLQLVHAQTPSVYQVAQMCAYAWLPIALLFAFISEKSRRPFVWLAAASLATGLMAISRPNFLPASAFLAVPWWRAWRRRDNGKRLARASLTTAGPLIMCGMVAVIHNQLRFGNFLEFGNRFQLADIDQRTIVVFSEDFFWSNTRLMLFTPPQFGAYFPFVHAELAPIGVLLALPFAWFTLGLFLTTRNQRATALTVLIAFAGVYVPLSFFCVCWARYQIDFCGPLMLAAGFGWLVFWQRAERIRGAVTWLGVGMAAFTILVSLGYTARLAGESERLKAVARLANLPVAWWEQWNGVNFGPVRLSVKFPEKSDEVAEPLLKTGWKGRDLVTVRRVNATNVVFGFFHEGAGGPVSKPIAIKPGSTHEVEIAMGSLLPPAEHPFFMNWDKSRQIAALRELRISLDGVVILRADTVFYETRPMDLEVGTNGGLSNVARSHFEGNINMLGRGDSKINDGVWPRDGGPILLSVVFPENQTPRSEPLLTTGWHGAGDMVFVSYLGNNRMRFGWVHAGGGQILSPIVQITPGQHDILVRMPAMLREQKGLFHLALDGMELITVEASQHPMESDQTAYGIDTIQSGVAGVIFSGTIHNVTRVEENRISTGSAAPAKNSYGALEIAVTFAEAKAMGQTDPLVVTGVTGAGDLIVVQELAEGQVRFGADHWGVGCVWGEPLSIIPGDVYHIRVEMGSLWGSSATRAQKETVRVFLDKRLVLESLQPSYPASQENVHIGLNSIGGSSCGPEFRGKIINIKRIP